MEPIIKALAEQFPLLAREARKEFPKQLDGLFTDEMKKKFNEKLFGSVTDTWDPRNLEKLWGTIPLHLPEDIRFNNHFYKIDWDAYSVQVLHGPRPQKVDWKLAAAGGAGLGFLAGLGLGYYFWGPR